MYLCVIVLQKSLKVMKTDKLHIDQGDRHIIDILEKMEEEAGLNREAALVDIALFFY